MSPELLFLSLLAPQTLLPKPQSQLVKRQEAESTSCWWTPNGALPPQTSSIPGTVAGGKCYFIGCNPNLGSDPKFHECHVPEDIENLRTLWAVLLYVPVITLG